MSELKPPEEEDEFFDTIPRMILTDNSALQAGIAYKFRQVALLQDFVKTTISKLDSIVPCESGSCGCFTLLNSILNDARRTDKVILKDSEKPGYKRYKTSIDDALGRNWGGVQGPEQKALASQSIDECPDCGGCLGAIDPELIFEGDDAYCDGCGYRYVASISGDKANFIRDKYSNELAQSRAEIKNMNTIGNRVHVYEKFVDKCKRAAKLREDVDNSDANKE